MADLVDLLRRVSIASDRREADVLDRVRLSIGTDDTDAWNALLYAASHLRFAADRTEQDRRLAHPTAREGE